MALETGTYISDLVSTNPVSSDNISQGDDHIRLLKSTIKATFPNITGVLGVYASGTGGNVGIGGAPTQKLDVYKGTVNSAIAQFTGNNSGRGLLISTAATTFADDTVKLDAQMASNGVMVLATGGTERVRVDASGRVGIGTTPITRLDIVGPGSGDPAVRLSDGTVDYRNYLSGGIAYHYTLGAHAIEFGTNNTARMRIDSSGNVGIGTNTQTDKLVVAGAASDTWATNSAGLSINGLGAANSVSVISTFLDTTSLRIGAGTTQKTGLLITGQTSASGSTVQFSTGGSERMRIDSSGNVLVTSSGGLGYGTGSGGTVTQATNKSTGVTLNKTNGRITMNNAALAAGAQVTFAVSNTTVASTNTIMVSGYWGAAFAGNYRIEVESVYTNGFTVRVTNISGVSLSDAPEFNFSVIKAVTA